MPFLAPVVTFAVGAISSVAGFLTAGGLLGQLGRSALFFGLSQLSKPKKAKAAPDQGLELRKRIATDHPIEVLFGEMATPGSLVWWGIRGSTNEFYEQVLLLSDYTCDSVVKIFGDGVELTFDGDVTTGYRDCTSHYLGEDGTSHLTVRVYLGDPNQTADSELVANYTEITSNFRGRGRAYAIVRQKWNRDAFPNGEAGLLFVMRGAPVYDPRLDTTAGGSGSHRSNDPTTWEWSNNPALIDGQYLQGFSLNGSVFCGMGYSRDRIPAADLIESANECDVTVALKAGGTEKTYTASGSFLTGKTGRSHQGNVEMVTAAMDGEIDDGNGREFRFIPGVERTPVSLEIAWDDLSGSDAIQFSPNIDPAERINTAGGLFTDPDAVYETRPIPFRQNATYVSEDNGQEYFYEPNLIAVTSGTQGQRIVNRAMERARAERRLALTLPLTYARLEKGDRTTLDATMQDRLRLPDTVWRVERRPTITPDLRCEIVLREHPDSVGDWTPATDELDPDGGGTFTTPGILGLTVSGMTANAYELTQGSAKIPIIRLAWVAGDSRLTVNAKLTRLDGASPPAPVSPSELLTGAVNAADGRIDLQVVPGGQYKVEYFGTVNDRIGEAVTVEAALTATANLEPTGVDATGIDALDLINGPAEADATAGANWDSDVANIPTNLDALSGSEVINNTGITVDGSGVLQGIGTPSIPVSNNNIGVAQIPALPTTKIDSGTFDNARIAQSNVTQHEGAVNALNLTNAPSDAGATAGADWSADVSNRPTELTDGRVGSGLAANGDIARDVPDAIKTSSDILSRSGGGTFSGDLTSTDNSGTIDSSGDIKFGTQIEQSSGGSKRGIPFGMGIIELADGDSVTYATAYDVAPTVHFAIGAGLTYATGGSFGSGEQFTSFQALSPTASGFTMRAKIEQIGSTTTTNDAVTTTGGTYSYEGEKSTSDDAVDNNYIFSGSIDCTFSTSGSNSATVTLDFYTDDGAGPVLRKSVPYLVTGSGSGVHSLSISEVISVASIGQGSQAEFAIDISAASPILGTLTATAVSSGNVNYEAGSPSAETAATSTTRKILCLVGATLETIE